MNAEQAINHLGSPSVIAKLLGLNRAVVSVWKKTGIPIQRQCQIEILTNGSLQADRGLLFSDVLVLSDKEPA